MTQLVGVLEVSFSVRHLMLLLDKGNFKKINSTVTLAETQADPGAQRFGGSCSGREGPALGGPEPGPPGVPAVWAGTLVQRGVTRT